MKCIGIKHKQSSRPIKFWLENPSWDPPWLPETQLPQVRMQRNMATRALRRWRRWNIPSVQKFNDPFLEEVVEHWNLSEYLNIFEYSFIFGAHFRIWFYRFLGYFFYSQWPHATCDRNCDLGSESRLFSVPLKGIPWHGQIWSCAAVTCYKNVTRIHMMWVDVGFSVVESDCFVCHFCYERGKPNTFPCLWILWPWRHLHGGSWMVLLDSQHVS